MPRVVKKPRTRALAITTLKRSPLMPETRTLAEQGVRDFEATGWNAFVGPAGLPAAVVQKVNDIVNRFIASGEGLEGLRRLGMQPSGGTPKQLADFIAAEIRTWRPIAELVSVE